MSKSIPRKNEIEPLIKIELADRLREQIVSGALQPGMRIVEATWGKKFGVAQGSIREAINILTQEGFVSKASGRSARVVSLREDDVLHLYEFRGGLEGLAARLAAGRNPDIANLKRALDKMRRAVKRNLCQDLIDGDLEFHLELCRLAGNPYVFEHARKILLPFFAFVRIRIIATGQDTLAWNRDLEAHQRIIDLLQEGEAEVVEQYVRRAMIRFAKTAYDNWEKRTPTSKRSKKAAERNGE